MTVSDILREHALYHDTAEFWAIPTPAGDEAFNKLMEWFSQQWFNSACVPENERRMALLFVAEALENPC